MPQLREAVTTQKIRLLQLGYQREGYWKVD
jgi:hypothetical protein